jgi:hypothetical protein
MFHGTICGGKKGPGTFWEKEWGSMDSKKYNEFILSQIQAWFEAERAHGVQLVWQQDEAFCHRFLETQDNLYRRNLVGLDAKVYSRSLFYGLL